MKKLNSQFRERNFRLSHSDTYLVIAENQLSRNQDGEMDPFQANLYIYGIKNGYDITLIVKIDSKQRSFASLDDRNIYSIAPNPEHPFIFALGDSEGSIVILDVLN